MNAIFCNNKKGINMKGSELYCSIVVKFSDLHNTLFPEKEYRKTSNIRRTLVGNKIVDHSDVVGASPVGAAPTTSSFST